MLGLPEARADEPRQPTEPIVLSDTAVDLLDVADAFDRGDPFDVNLRLSFDHEQRSAPIKREASSQAAGGYQTADLPVGTYHESIQRLVPEIEIGIVRDFALKLRMPVILADNRRIEGSAGSTDASFQGAPGEVLFSTPFTSPTRSGIEYLAVGLDLALMNQFRRPHQPNWVMGIEGRFSISDPMRACNTNPAPGQVECAYSEDINRNGENDPLGPAFDAELEDGSNLADQNEGNFSGSRSPGVSRGTHAVQGHAYVSKRLKYIEPYTGVEALAEFQIPSSAYGPTSLEGVVVNHPPLRGTLIAGVAVVPWEEPEKFSRLAIDMRVTGTYVSPGRDYSELFDALGSSDAYSLRAPNFETYQPNLTPTAAEAPSIADPNSTRINFTGVTEVQQHGDYKLRAQVTWQAGKWVKFDLGLAYRIIQAHFITIDQPCNLDIVGEAARSGPCAVRGDVVLPGEPGDTTGVGYTEWASGGLPNPSYRAVINDPGQRYRVEASHGLQAWFRASVLF